jgi:hypothetical protein
VENKTSAAAIGAAIANADILQSHRHGGITDMPIVPASCTLALETALAFCLCSMPPQIAYAATPPGDACSLFTRSQVSRVLGVPVTDGQHPITSSLLLCGWAPPGGPQIDGKKLTVNLMTERAFEVGKTLQGVAKTSVSGVGDEAYYVTAGGLGTGLCIKTGSTYVRIRVGGFPMEKQKELEKALALQMLTKL